MTFAVPNGHRVYAIGDIHGMAEALDDLLSLIEADIEASPVERVTEVFLGDYVDRGPDSAGVIDQVLTSRPGRERVALMGNHEDALLRALGSCAEAERWLAFGAGPTLASYGLDSQALMRDPAAVATQLFSVLPEAHLTFLERLPRWHRIGDVVFVHAGVRPGVALEEQDPHELMWIRDEFLRYDGPHPFHVVHGHTPVAQPDHRAYRTNIDTGAGYGRVLSAAVLEGSTIRFLSVPVDQADLFARAPRADAHFGRRFAR